MKYGILGEDKSDANTLKVLVRRLHEAARKNRTEERLIIKTKNYHGWSELCRKGARNIRLLATLGCRRFIVCVDADGPTPNERRKLVQREVIGKAGISLPLCLIVPVQELEAWIVADIEGAAPKVILSWNPGRIRHPESQDSPKEHLRRLSRDPHTKKARYNEVLHNERLAEYLRLEKIESKCPSFAPLAEFVQN